MPDYMPLLACGGGFIAMGLSVLALYFIYAIQKGLWHSQQMRVIERYIKPTRELFRMTAQTGEVITVIETEHDILIRANGRVVSGESKEHILRYLESEGWHDLIFSK